MKTIYTENLRQSSDLYPLAHQAAGILEEMVGKFLLPITAEWDRETDDRGRPAIVVRLSDPIETATARFTPAEAGSAALMERRLSRLWSGWLRDSSHKRLESLFQSINETIGF